MRWTSRNADFQLNFSWYVENGQVCGFREVTSRFLDECIGKTKNARVPFSVRSLFIREPLSSRSVNPKQSTVVRIRLANETTY